MRLSLPLPSSVAVIRIAIALAAVFAITPGLKSHIVENASLQSPPLPETLSDAHQALRWYGSSYES